MSKLAIISFLTLAAIGCNSGAQQTATTNVSLQNNANVSLQKSDDSTIVSSHSADAEKSVSSQPSKMNSTASADAGSPMSRAIDVKQMTADVEKADKSYKQNQKDEKAKDKLAEAYFVRAFALTEAAQYRSALGDFRKGLKLKPDNADAKAMHDRILSIFESIKREPPKEGEEPAPMPFNES